MFSGKFFERFPTISYVSLTAQISPSDFSKTKSCVGFQFFPKIAIIFGLNYQMFLSRVKWFFITLHDVTKWINGDSNNVLLTNPSTFLNCVNRWDLFLWLFWWTTSELVSTRDILKSSLIKTWFRYFGLKRRTSRYISEWPDSRLLRREVSETWHHSLVKLFWERE